MPVQMANPKERNFAILLSKDMIRLRDPNTGDFLHLSGKGTTADTAQSWLGFRHQAATLQERAVTRGEDWPFEPVHRTLLEPARQVAHD